jgi:DNA modification methylase
MSFSVIQGDCEEMLEDRFLSKIDFFNEVDLTFLDPPFNQDKYYASHNDSMSEQEYWKWMERIAKKVYQLTRIGGVMYFMQREKNTEYVLQCLRSSGWSFQNLIVWKKMTSAVPSQIRFGKQYQIIAFASKGKKPRVFNRLRIDLPLHANYKYEREKGVYVTDIWDDIRELTSGYFAGEEPLRDKCGERFHKQQSPIHLLLRIILSSSNPRDLILDPFAGTGTTAVVSEQIGRNSINIELDSTNVEWINNRIYARRTADDVSQYYEYYRYTPNLEKLWTCDSPIQGKLFDV